MGIVIRQSLKATAVTLLGSVMGAVSIVVASRLVGQQELGFSRMLAAYGSVAGILLTLGFHAVVSVFLFRHAADAQKRASILGLGLLIPVVVSLLLFGVYFLFKENLLGLFRPADQPLFRKYFPWFPVISLLVTVQAVLEGFLMTEMKITVFTTVREVGLKGGNLLLILLFGLGAITFSQWIYGIAALYGVANVLLLFSAWRTGHFRVSFQWRALSRRELYDIFHFAGFHALLGVTVYLVGFLDSMMLAPLDRDGLTASAIYTSALFIISLLQIPYRAMTSSVTPNLTEAYAQDDLAKVKDVFTRSSVNIFLATLGMAVLIIANLKKGVELLGAGYELVTPLVLVLMIGRLLDAATGINEQVLSVSKHYRYSFVLSLFLAVALFALGYALIPRYGVYGAAWASTAALGLYNVGKWAVVWRKTGLQPFSAATFRMVMAAGLALVPAFLIPEIPVWLVDVGVRTAIVSTLYLLLLLWLRPSPDFNNMTLGLLRKMRRGK